MDFPLSFRRLRRAATAGALALLMALGTGMAQAQATSYDALVTLFQEWRALEQPKLRDGAPDYTPAGVAEREQGLRALQARHRAMDTSGWTQDQQIDWHLLWAEMNGLDFYLRVLKPWARDPAYYASIRSSQSDTPSEEGPTIHNSIRLWKYSMWPRTALDKASALTAEAEAQLAAELRTIPPLLKQAKGNLADSNTRDLWQTAVTTFHNQEGTLASVAEKIGKPGKELQAAVKAAQEATTDFRKWLEVEAPKRTGPSGVTREEYTWHLRNVLLVNSSWEEEVTLMERELARGHAMLRMEENRNRDLPPQAPVSSAEEFARVQAASIESYIRFMEEKDILTVKPYLERALRERVFTYKEPGNRNFFDQCTHRDPRTLWTHFYHYWDLERMALEPHASPIRSKPSLYNIWMSRAEGVATGMEEWMMNAGLFDDQPRSREINWIMLITRSARGLASLHAQDNLIDIKQASDIHVEWTPRDWMDRKTDLLGFEQQMYLRQPGYGPTYITGARQIDMIIAERARQLGDEFSLKRFFDEMNNSGMLPVALLRWAVTGNDSDIKAIVSDPYGKKLSEKSFL